MLQCSRCPRSYHSSCLRKDLAHSQTRATKESFMCSACSDRPAKPICFSCKKECTYAAVECSLCKETRHIECLRVPLKFLFAGGSQARNGGDTDFEFAQSLGYKLIEAKVDGSGITPRQIVSESLGKHGARYDEQRDMVMLD